MNQNLQNYLNNNVPIINLNLFFLNIMLTIVLSIILSWFYAKFGNSLSNRKLFSRNFIMISLTTMLVITIVKSSLALSLGLVGALSIVRFRAAIKEPEELSYLFLAIALGLGFGANQTLITSIAFIVILSVIFLMKIFNNEFTNQESLFLNIRTQSVSVNSIIAVLKKNCDSVNLKRLDEPDLDLELTFTIVVNNFSKIENIKDNLKNLDKKMNISFINNQNLI